MQPPSALPSTPPAAALAPQRGAVSVRPLTAADGPAYKALRDEALRTAPDAFTSDYASAVAVPAAAYVARFGAPASGRFFLGAFDAQGRLLGCIGCEREPRAQQRHCATVVGMVVTPSAQRRGVGRQLLQACIETACHVPGLRQLVLSVTASNTHVVRLYEQAGFTTWGLQPHAVVVNGVGYDKLHMLRWLVSPPGPPGPPGPHGSARLPDRPAPARPG